ncbi:hypothetical protein [Bradyrhizobium sp. JYMT SZCCT0428]|uniref:hypothetical protein n=1 Tax=Bradyrhizobium sp. JYMT SZCCT0428 TaxID=2807673 RepID=UPI001BAE40F2|nr:hypothetical protein [Bradyrhizobium sp. JYMT SZCCT0428]MBR1150079.1 hypothetical protein [Bradyrhizobium sp. JYMT SZCCT0428]
MNNDLLHFVPLTETVTIRGKKIKLRGIDIGELGQLFFRFPDVAAMMAKRQFDVQKAAVSKEAMVAFAVAGAGQPGDAAMEKSFANLSLGELAVLFKSVFKLTAPGGIGPFVELVLTLQGKEGAEEDAAAAPKKERKGVKVQVRP